MSIRWTPLYLDYGGGGGGGSTACPVYYMEACMSNLLIPKGSTNVSVEITILDSTTFLPETAVEHNTAGIDLWYRRDGAAVTSITEVALAALTTAHTDGGIEHISHGVYRLDLPDAAWASGVDKVTWGGTVTGMIVIGGSAQLTDIDPFDAVRGGMTALPNANADAAGGLPISDAGGLDLDAMNTNINDIETDTNELQQDWANGGRLDLILDELTTNVDAIEADTQDLQTQIGTAGAGLTGIPWNASWDAEVQSEVEDGLIAHGLDHLVGASVADTDVADNSIIAKLVDSTSVTADFTNYDWTTDSLRALRDRGDAAWITATGFSTHTAADVRTEMDSNSTQLAAIVADTNELQTDWVNGGRLDLILDELTTNIDAIETDTQDLQTQIGTAGAGLTAVPWNAAWDAEVQSEVNDGLVALGLDHLVSAAVVGTDITDNSIIAYLASSSATADWDTFVNTTDSLQAIADGGGGLTAAQVADAVWDEAQGDHTTAGTFGEIATEIASILVDTAEIGTAGAGLSNIPWNASWDAEVESEVNDGLVALGLDHLVSASVAGTDITDDSIIAQLVSSSGVADWDTYDNATDSLQALRDRGDAAWTTGGGGSNPILLQNTTIATLASQTSFTLTAGSADDDAYNGCFVVVTDSATSTQKAIGRISDYTGSTKTVTLNADPAIFTMAVGDTVDVIANALPYADEIRSEMDANSTQLAAIVADTGELQTDWANGGRLDLILDELTVNIDAIETDTQDIQTQIGTAGAGLTDLGGMSTAMKAEVNAEADTALADYDAPTNTEMVAAFTEIKGSTWSSATDTLEAIRDRGDAAWITATGFSTHTAADVWTSGTRTLTANTNLNDPTAAAIADAVWDELQSGHVTAGSFGEIATEIADILTDTNDLQTNQGNWLTATGFSTHSAADVADAVWDELQSAHVGAGTFGETATEIAAILVDTNSLNDTKIPDTISLANINAEVDTAIADYDPPTNAEMEARTVNAATVAKLEAGALATVTGQAATGTLNTTTMTTNLTEATDDHYNGRVVVFTSGALLGQAAAITDYSGTNGTITMTAVTEAPSNGDTFVIV